MLRRLKEQSHQLGKRRDPKKLLLKGRGDNETQEQVGGTISRTKQKEAWRMRMTTETRRRERQRQRGTQS